ncbi:MAG: methionyl-tRNA formyltransferase [Actinomycetota bacterium]
MFLGNDPWSVPPLDAVAASRHRPALVATRVPRPAGRGSRLTPTAVAEAARRLSLPLREVETVKSGEGLDALAAAAPDVLVVVAYGEILPAAVLGLPRIAPVNLHFSLLPELRGASPVQHALLRGLDRTGVTTIVMDEGLDTGPVLVRREEDVRPEDDAGSLGERLARVGGEALVATLDGLADGTLAPTPQQGEPTFASKLKPEDRWLRWTEPAADVVRRVRALSPDPAASTRFRGDVLKVFRAAVDEAGGPAPDPGAVLGVDGDALVVGAGKGAVRLEEVAPAGRRRMTGADFARGHRPHPGERLREE